MTRAGGGAENKQIAGEAKGGVLTHDKNVHQMLRGFFQLRSWWIYVLAHDQWGWNILPALSQYVQLKWFDLFARILSFKDRGIEYTIINSAETLIWHGDTNRNWDRLFSFSSLPEFSCLAGWQVTQLCNKWAPYESMKLLFTSPGLLVKPPKHCEPFGLVSRWKTIKT